MTSIVFLLGGFIAGFFAAALLVASTRAEAEHQRSSVLALHYRATDPDEHLCACCRSPWPCQTVLALTGEDIW